MMRQNVPPISILLLLLSLRASSQQDDGFKDDVTEEPSASNDFWSSLVTNPMYQVPVASGHVYFTEAFQTKEGFLKRWTYSQVGAEETAARPASKHDGLWRIEEMKRSSLRGDLGLVLKRSSKYHAISVPLDEPFEFDDRPLIVQYEVKFQADQDCGGAYIKLLTKADKLDLSNFSGKTPYTIMFGPDKCGKDEKIHFIFRHKNPVTGHFEERHSRPPSVEFGEIFTDKKIHLYTLGVYPNNSFEIYLDQTRINSGNLFKDTLQDESMDEKWESSVTVDPVCLLSDGCDPSSQSMIKEDPKQRRESLTQPLNSESNSQDKSSQKITPTPDHSDDQEPYRLLPISALGLELWSTSANIFFDNFIVTDDKQIADQWAENGWKQKKTMEIANSQGLRGMMVYLYDSGLERRWLWGVYAFVFLLPFILVSVFFCPETGPLFKASMIANAVRPGEEDEEAEARRKERKKERTRKRKTSKKTEEQSEDQLKDKVEGEAVDEREEDTDGSDSSENESSHLQSRQKVRRRKTKKTT